MIPEQNQTVAIDGDDGVMRRLKQGIESHLCGMRRD
jgi:hypothetical protein